MDPHVVAGWLRRPGRSLVESPRGLDFVEPPLTPQLWDAYESWAHSYGCTRAFLEYFDDPSPAILAQLRSPGGGPEAWFLYRAERARIRVLGRFYRTPIDCLAAFARGAFARHPGARRIETDFIDALPDMRALDRPALALREGLELRIALPGDVATYEQALEPAFLKRMRYHERRLARRHPATRITTLEREAVPRSWIAEIVRLNHERRSLKRSVSVFSPRYEEGISRVVRAHGQVTVLRDGERIRAGVINVIAGPDVYFWVIGHAAEYNRFTPGTLCLLASIRACIGSGARTFHLLQGDSEYKREVGGKPAALASYVVLRSWRDLQPGDVRRLLVKHAMRRARQAMRSMEGGAASAAGRGQVAWLARQALGWAGWVRGGLHHRAR